MINCARYSFEARSPYSLKYKILKIVKALTLPVIAKVSSNRNGKILRCLHLHSVFDDQIISFDKILDGLCEKGEFINTDRCCRMIEGKEPINSNYFHLSFDDGFKNNLDNAANILRKKNIPACFFVISGLIGRYYPHTKIPVNRKYIEMLSWDDCKKLLDLGFDIYSHSRTHVKLAEISYSDDLLEKELRGSKEELEEKLGIDCKYISWPYGIRKYVNPKVIDKIKKVGYKACFGAFRGKITHPDPNILFEIPRHHFEPDWPLSHILALMSGIWG